MPPTQDQGQNSQRKVHNDACVEVGANCYSVPWALVGCTVLVRLRDQAITVSHAGRVVARHEHASGRRQRVVDPLFAEWIALLDSGLPEEP